MWNRKRRESPPPPEPAIPIARDSGDQEVFLLPVTRRELQYLTDNALYGNLRVDPDAYVRLVIKTGLVTDYPLASGIQAMANVVLNLEKELKGHTRLRWEAMPETLNAACATAHQIAGE